MEKKIKCNQRWCRRKPAYKLIVTNQEREMVVYYCQNHKREAYEYSTIANNAGWEVDMSQLAEAQAA